MQLESIKKGDNGEQQSLEERKETAKQMLTLIDKLQQRGAKSEIGLLKKIAENQPQDTSSVIQSTISHLSSLSDDTESFKEILITLSDQIKSYLLELEENLGVSTDNALTLEQSLQVNIQLESELVTGFHNELVNILKDKSLAVGHQKDALTVAKLIDAESSIISAEITSLICDDEPSPSPSSPPSPVVDSSVPSPPPISVPEPTPISSPSPTPTTEGASPAPSPSPTPTEDDDASTESVAEFDKVEPEQPSPIEDTLDVPPPPPPVEEQATTPPPPPSTEQDVSPPTEESTVQTTSPPPSPVSTPAGPSSPTPSDELI